MDTATGCFGHRPGRSEVLRQAIPGGTACQPEGPVRAKAPGSSACNMFTEGEGGQKAEVESSKGRA